MKKRKFADGGETESSDVPPEGRFAKSDPDIYSRARKWVEAQKAAESAAPETPRPKAASKPVARPVAAPAAAAAPKAPTPAPTPRAEPAAAASSGRAEIPVGDEKAPPKDDSYQPGEMGRNILNAMSAVSPGIGRAASAAARSAPAVGAGARVAGEGIGAAVKYGPRAGMDVAKSTARGAAGRADIRAARAARDAEADAAAVRGAAGRAEIRATRDAEVNAAATRGAASRAEVKANRAAREAATAPAEQAQRMTTARRGASSKDRMTANKARKEDTEGVEFRKGGSVRGCGLAQRGHGKGSMR